MIFHVLRYVVAIVTLGKEWSLQSIALINLDGSLAGSNRLLFYLNLVILIKIPSNEGNVEGKTDINVCPLGLLCDNISIDNTNNIRRLQSMCGPFQTSPLVWLCKQFL